LRELNAKRFPVIVDDASRIKVTSFLIHGEAAIVRPHIFHLVRSQSGPLGLGTIVF
jgi:hypothetical protein